MKERKGIFVLRILLNILFPIRKLLFPWVPVIKKVSSRERIKILLFFMSPGIGDAVISTFFLRGLRQIFPNSVIDLFTVESASLITNNPALDRFTIVSATEQHNLKLLLHRLPALRKEKYDIIIDIPWFQKGYSASVNTIRRNSMALKKAVYFKKGILDVLIYRLSNLILAI